MSHVRNLIHIDVVSLIYRSDERDVIATIALTVFPIVCKPMPRQGTYKMKLMYFFMYHVVVVVATSASREKSHSLLLEFVGINKKTM